MARALEELVVVGVDTSAPLHRSVMDEADFRAGALSIRYLEEHPELTDGRPDEAVLRAAAVAAALLEEERRSRHRTPRIGAGSGTGMSAWRRAGWPWTA
jgi:acetyl-CoA carboxylase biotin carboxylase subunit